LTILLAVAATSWAEDPVADNDVPSAPALTFNSDSVLVATFQPLDDESEADAARLFDLVSARLGQSNELVPMSAVPRFEPQGYDGPAYMRGCPPGKYGGCALVLGQRAGSDRAIGATVRREEDEFEEGKSTTIMTVYVVDVLEAREIASFGIPIEPDHETHAADGIARVLDDVVKGDYELRDLRERGQAPDEAALEEARRERLAPSLAALEENLGTAVRSDSIRLLPNRVTREDLVEYERRDELPPWERVGMSQPQYLRYINSGDDLETWRRDGWGRFAKVLLRASAGFTNGPWHQSYVGQIYLHETDLTPVHQVQYLEMRNASSMAGELEVGVGLAPFVDVAFATVLRTGQTTVMVDEDVLGQVPIPSEEVRYAKSSVQLGLRGQFSPFPRWPARPTAAVGLGWWSGAGITASERMPHLDAPNALLLELIPGVELDASRTVALTARLLESVPIGGTFVQSTETGSVPPETTPPVPLRDYGPGISLHAGVLVRLGPLIQPPAPKVRTYEDEEEL
jgi:hypothetical protein